MEVKEFVTNIMIFSHWRVFIHHLSLQTPWTNVIKKTKGLFQSHNGVCFSKADTISRIFKEKGEPLSQISLDHQNNMKDRIMSLNTMNMYKVPPLALSNLRAHTHTHTYTALSFVNQINILDPNEVSSGKERFILKCENIPGRKRQIRLRAQIRPINHGELGRVTALPSGSSVITLSTQQQLSLEKDTLYARQLQH